MPQWLALDQARSHDPSRRLAFHVMHHGRLRTAGCVAREHLPALGIFKPWLTINDAGLVLDVEIQARDAALAAMNESLRQQGLVRGWRDECYPVPALDDGNTLLATLERAAARFWGTLTTGAHCNGYVADEHGQPASLWVAQRSLTKPTDPGALDNLIGGGVPHGQTPLQALLREGWEEAGLQPAQMTGLRSGRVLHLLRDLPEGLQREQLWVYDLALPAGAVPVNQDGEVAALQCMTMPEALEATDRMTVDAALVTLDFALRHGLLPAAQAERLVPRLDQISGAWQG